MIMRFEMGLVLQGRCSRETVRLEGAAASDAARGRSAFGAAAELTYSSSGLLEPCSSWAEGL